MLEKGIADEISPAIAPRRPSPRSTRRIILLLPGAARRRWCSIWESRGDKVLVGGWQCHLTILVDKAYGRVPPAFWDVFRLVSGD
jgi:hypothetical protein